ncbi:hypothetical protein TcasGA2_TC016119 [Tribolium castaneum]|uniref:Uncharacterized protein n=1 Tax=Tribolium castaneum TaxID=7070 RepID=D7EIR2_TRICA|nr:hypothetical protein TcasGA2_TC016119 [Tribolium castaneum]
MNRSVDDNNDDGDDDDSDNDDDNYDNVDINNDDDNDDDNDNDDNNYLLFTQLSSLINKRFFIMEHNLKIAHVNTRSLLTGFDAFTDNVLENNFDIMGVSETWLMNQLPSRVVDVLRHDLNG